MKYNNIPWQLNKNPKHKLSKSTYKNNSLNKSNWGKTNKKDKYNWIELNGKKKHTSLGRKKHNRSHDHYHDNDAEHDGNDNSEEEVEEDIHHWNSPGSFDIEEDEVAGRLHNQVAVEEGSLRRKVAVVLMGNPVAVVL